MTVFLFLTVSVIERVTVVFFYYKFVSSSFSVLGTDCALVVTKGIL